MVIEKSPTLISLYDELPRGLHPFEEARFDLLLESVAIPSDAYRDPMVQQTI